jgi:hypothetical protein
MPMSYQRTRAGVVQPTPDPKKNRPLNLDNAVTTLTVAGQVHQENALLDDVLRGKRMGETPAFSSGYARLLHLRGLAAQRSDVEHDESPEDQAERDATMRLMQGRQLEAMNDIARDS